MLLPFLLHAFICVVPAVVITGVVLLAAVVLFAAWFPILYQSVAPVSFCFIVTVFPPVSAFSLPIVGIFTDPLTVIVAVS